MCDPESGVCEIVSVESQSKKDSIRPLKKPIRVIYFTDPICSSCWGIEPQLRKLKLEYGHDMELEYRMGGLLPDWSYNSGGISKPSDVALHWDEVSAYYKMPIDGDIWLEDPLNSSYPPSIAFKAAQLQDPKKAIEFLRTLREMVFLQKKNITKWENIEKAAIICGLDPVKLKSDFEGSAKKHFEDDLSFARSMGVRGFPTLLFFDQHGNSLSLYGFQPYVNFEEAIVKLHPTANKVAYKKDWRSLFATYTSLTTREFAELSNQTIEEGQKELEALFLQNEIEQLVTKNGVLWISKN